MDRNTPVFGKKFTKAAFTLLFGGQTDCGFVPLSFGARAICTRFFGGSNSNTLGSLILRPSDDGINDYTGYQGTQGAWNAGSTCQAAGPGAIAIWAMNMPYGFAVWPAPYIHILMNPVSVADITGVTMEAWPLFGDERDAYPTNASALPTRP